MWFNVVWSGVAQCSPDPRQPPRLPSFLKLLQNHTKPARLAQFWQGAESIAPASKNDSWTCKSGPNVVCLSHFDFDMCFTPQQRALFRHLNFQKWSEQSVVYHFHFDMCVPPQRRTLFQQLNLQMCSEQSMRLHAFTIFASKCASRHSRVHFFEISSCQSARNARCF